MLKTLAPAQPQIDISANLHVSVFPSIIPKSVIRPYRVNYYDPPDFRMLKGWPMAVPDYDVRVEALVDVEGITLAVRPNVYDLDISSDVRWIADANSFSDINLTWYPYQSQLGTLPWQSAPQWMPTLVEDYTYVLGNEQFTTPLVNFDAVSAEHMWCNVTALEGSYGYTIIMVCNLNSVYSGEEETNHNGIIGNGYPTTQFGILDDEEDFIENPWQALINTSSLIIRTDSDRGETPIGDLISRTPPCYLAFAVGRPEFEFYAARGPMTITPNTVSSGELGVPFSSSLVLARSFGDTLHTADLAVMEIDLYARKLDKFEVKREITRLAKFYGSE